MILDTRDREAARVTRVDVLVKRKVEGGLRVVSEMIGHRFVT